MKKSIKLTKTDAVLHNPGCGAMLLQRGANKIRFDQLPQDAWFLKEKLVDKIEFAIPWSVLEPEEGKILWDHPDWEGCINSWIDAGFKIALEVRGMDTWGTFYNQGVPQWVFDAGAKYVDEPLELYKGGWTLNFLNFDEAEHPVRYPVYWDEVYLEKAGNLIKAMGERYNGRPEIEYVCNGMMGRWGEMHLSSHSPLKPWFDAGFSREIYVETLCRLIDMHKEAFPDTRICQEICAPVFGEDGGEDYLSFWDVPEIYEYLAANKVIIKNNSIGKSWHGNRSLYIDQPVLEIFDKYYTATPVACENLVLKAALEEALRDTHISYWHPGGEKEGLHILEHEKNIPIQEKKVWSCYKFFPGDYDKMTIEDEKNIWRMMARHCGYRLEIDRIETDGSQVTVHWNNSGSAPCYEDLTIYLELSQDDKIITSLTCAAKADGVEIFDMPCSADGANTIKLKLSSPRGTIELGNLGKTSDGSYRWQI